MKDPTDVRRPRPDDRARTTGRRDVRRRRRAHEQRRQQQGRVPDDRRRHLQRQDRHRRSASTRSQAIYYEAQTNLLTSASDYQDLYDALQQACANLIGTDGITAADCQQVKNALDARRDEPPAAAGAPPPRRPSARRATPTNLFFDNLENPASGNWTRGALVGSNRWYYPQNSNPFSGFDATYATSGVTNFWGTDSHDARRTRSSRRRRASRCRRARRTSASTTRTCFEHRRRRPTTTAASSSTARTAARPGTTPARCSRTAATTATLYAASEQPARRAARRSPATQHGYGSSRLDLSSLAGQNVRFRFRIGHGLEPSATTAGSSTTSASTPARLSAPGAPTNVRARAGDGEATVSFPAPSSGGSPDQLVHGDARARAGRRSRRRAAASLRLRPGQRDAATRSRSPRRTRRARGRRRRPRAPVIPAYAQGRPDAPALRPRSRARRCPTPPAGGAAVPPPGLDSRASAQQ